jgi:hypothetical protein
MAPADLLSYLRACPFRPFRIIMLDGTAYEIRHPDLVMVGLTSTVIGYPGPSDPSYYLRFDLIDTRHVTRMEYIDQPAPAQGADGAGGA